jgi:enamine deaminase RidA (YjgF/YER057c/UK114 family)
MDFLQPPGWTQPRGYTNGIAAHGRTVCVSGMIGWDAQGVFQCSDLVGQVKQTLQNIVDVLAEAEARPEHIVRMTWYLMDRKSVRFTGKSSASIIRR